MTKAQHSISETAAVNPAAALWRIVVSEYEAARAQFAANWAAYEAADDEFQETEAYRRKRELQAAYGLRDYMTMDEALEVVDRAIAKRDGTERGELPDEAVDAQAKEAERIVGEYKGLNAALMAIAERLEVNKLRDEHNNFTGEAFYPAREKLFATPAPDIAALLFKAEVLATTVDEAEGLRDDLNRLLGGK